ESSRRAPALAPEGLTLRAESEPEQAAPAGLTLLPAQDQGPAVRSPITERTPPRLHVEGAAPFGQLKARAALLDGEAGQGQARTVAFNVARQ
ncbi:MAG: hypothetical protein KKA55_05520, partial [Proteobacteria bacterium]|nr:hypothetical protein [Pseudomonadota bacterium]MBU1594980.1 hypothetical protein [Pseudomonadota bacterium]